MPKKGQRKKTPRNIESPDPKKRPTSLTPNVEGPLAWRFSACDRNGPWAWTSLEPAEKHKEVIERFHEFETKNPGEIRQTGSHSIQLSELIPEALQRLREIKQDDVDELMSFRINGRNRVWCIQDQSVMKVLWWDPDHEVCPSLKKNT